MALHSQQRWWEGWSCRGQRAKLPPLSHTGAMTATGVVASRHAITRLRICSLWQRQRQIRGKIRATGGEERSGVGGEVRDEEKRGRYRLLKVPGGEKERERERDFQSVLFITNPLPAECRRAERKNRSKTNTYSSYNTPVVLELKYKFTRFGGVERPHIHVCTTVKQRRERNWQHCIYIQIGWGCLRCFGTGCAQWALTTVFGVCVCVCLSALLVCISTWDLCLHQPCDGNLTSGGSSFICALPLRLRAFDQPSVMFVHCAASVAITAVRNLACLRREEIPALYLKQARDKKINGPIHGINWREKFTNMLRDYEKEICVWMGGAKSEGASSSSGW